MSRKRSPKSKAGKKRKGPAQGVGVSPARMAKKRGPPKKAVRLAVGICSVVAICLSMWRLYTKLRTSSTPAPQAPLSTHPTAEPPIAGPFPPETSGRIFTDVTEEAGIDFRHTTGQETRRMLYPEIMGAGVILFDYDGDGDLDIYFLNGNYLKGKKPDPKLTNVLYRNDTDRGTWHFTDVTEEAGVGDSGYGQGGEAADFDNDGDQDLYVTNLGTSVYFRNEGDGKFTRTSLLAHSGWGQCCSALDYDNDGDLDLYVVNYLTYNPDRQDLGYATVAGKLIHDYVGPQNNDGSADVLYRNNGDGTFTDVTKETGLYSPQGKGMGLGVADFDNDGDPDIFVANDYMVNYLFVNERGKFVEHGVEAGVAASDDGNLESSMGVDVADVDNDGLFDIMVPCRNAEIHTLYYNRWPVFYEGPIRSGLDRATLRHTGFSPNFLDYDNDGDMDLFISTGSVLTLSWAVMKGRTRPEHFRERYAEPDLLLENDGTGYFRAVPPGKSGPHFRTPTVSRGSAVEDMDNDGDIDIVVSIPEGRPVLLRNDGKGGHWLTLRLIGTKSNRDAIGARVIARVGDKTQYHYLRGGGSYLSVNDRRVHLGLGTATTLDRIEIVWPSGTRQALENIPADQFLTVEEPATDQSGGGE